MTKYSKSTVRPKEPEDGDTNFAEKQTAFLQYVILERHNDWLVPYLKKNKIDLKQGNSLELAGDLIPPESKMFFAIKRAYLAKPGSLDTAN